MSNTFHSFTKEINFKAYLLDYRRYCTLVTFMNILSLRYDKDILLIEMSYINDILLRRPYNEGIIISQLLRPLKNIGFELTLVNSDLDLTLVDFEKSYLISYAGHVEAYKQEFTTNYCAVNFIDMLHVLNRTETVEHIYEIVDVKKDIPFEDLIKIILDPCPY